MKQHYRIKFFYGGRCGGKSYAFADSLLFLGRNKKLFVACLREIQDSIRDSVYKLLCDRIKFYGLTDYKIFADKIENKFTETVFIFKGLREQDAQKIKSLEGVDIAWIEEAQTISALSWEVLEPTIRKDGSEIWISMNRLHENDALWVAVAANPDERTLVVKANYYDNPFCPKEMILQAKKCRQKNPENYAHIWLGEPIRQDNNCLIKGEILRRAFEQNITSTTSPLVIGLDIARFGDDKTVFCFRKGRWCYRFESYENKSNVEVANLATNFILSYHPYRVFMDVGGQGAGVFDILKDRGFAEVVRGVYFGEKAIRDERYFNRRAEMWGEIAEWLEEAPYPKLPDDENLYNELTSVRKDFDGRGRLKLEGKAEIKKRLGRSPDKADALALTFAEPVFEGRIPQIYGHREVCVEDIFNDATKIRTGW